MFMNLPHILFSVLILIQFGFHASAEVIEVRKITQPLNHAKPESGTYEQTYQILRPEKLIANTPVVLFLGSEAGPGDLQKMAEPFQKLHPIVAVQADHRGYGSYSTDVDQTIPTYVSMDQAIEDFHVIIQKLKMEFSGPILLVGHSYSATLAIMLAAKYPDDSQGIYASSATVKFPKFASFHDQKMKSSWSAELYGALAEKIKTFSNPTIGDQAYEDRLFLQTIFIGSVQYGKFAALKPYLEKTSALPTSQFITTWKGLDQQLAGEIASLWSSGQNTMKLSLSQAQTLKFHSRYWAYQQCAELGSFFTSDQSGSIFPQTFDDYSEHCFKLFGITPKVQNEWEIITLVATMKTPIIAINGANDPWADIQLKADSILPVKSKLILSPKGFHCPDREDSSIEIEAITSLFQLINSP